MISADEIIELIKCGKKQNKIYELICRQYNELREQGMDSKEAKELMDNLIYKLYIKGIDKKTISGIMHLSQSMIENRLNKTKRLNLKIEKEENDNKILEGLKEGKKQTEIAKELELTIGTVSNRIRKMKERGVEIPIVSDVIDNKILKGLKEGKTQTEIAKELKIPASSVSGKVIKMRERGVNIPNVSKPRKTINDETDNKILEGLKEGKTQTKIAKELKISRQRISQRVQKMREIGVNIPNISDEIDNKILERLKEGKTQAEIAKELNISISAVSQRVKKMRERGVEIPKVPKVRRTINDETDNKILKALEEEKTQTEIAKELNISISTISQRVKKMRERGVEIPNVPKTRKTKNDETDNKILKALEEEKTQTEIAKELKKSIQCISRRVQEMRKRGVEIPIVSDVIDNKILEGLKEGKTQTEIAKELKIHISTVSQRVKKMRERGIDIPNISEEKDKQILRYLEEGLTEKQIGDKVHLSQNGVNLRKKKLNRITNEKLAKEIIKLIYTKNATIEQVKIMGNYYGVDVESVLEQLEEREK